MHAAFRQRLVTLLIAALIMTCATVATFGQETRDFNVRRAFDDGSVTTPPTNNSLPSTNSPKRPILPITFSKRDDSAQNVVRGNGTANGSPLPLAPPKERKTQKPNASGPPSAIGSVTTILSSLAMVLGAFFLVAWFARRANPQTTATLPKEVVESLGRTSMGNRQYLQLVRIGNKLLLLAISSQGVETLTEITTPEEVERLTGLCQQHQPGSVTTTFRNILAQLGNEPTSPGFLGDAQADDGERARPANARRVRVRAREVDHDHD